MRRRLASLATAVVLVLAVASVGLASGGVHAEDSFSNANYTGGSGWANNNDPWSETGEATNPSAGVIRAVDSGCDGSSCVRFDAGLITLGTYRLSRIVDTSDAASVTIRFTYRRSGLGTFRVGTQSASRTLTGGTGGYSAESFTVPSADIGPNTQVQFSLSNLTLGADAHVDRVEVEVAYPSTTSTTTSTTSTSTTTTTLLPTTTTLPPITSTTLPNPLSTTTTIDRVGPTTPTTLAPGGSGGTPSTTSTTTGTSDTENSEGGRTNTSDDGQSRGLLGSTHDRDGGDDTGVSTQALTPDEIAIAEFSNIATNLAAEGDFAGFEGFSGIDPKTGLSVTLQSGVEAISSEFFSALGLGALIVILARKRVTDDDIAPETLEE